MLLCDENGKLIDGDDIMAIAALEMLAEKTLAEKTLVATVMSNAGLEAAIKDAGGKMLRTPVGDKNVIDEMLRERLQLRRRAERPFDFPRLRHDRRRPGGRAANFADS